MNYLETYPLDAEVAVEQLWPIFLECYDHWQIKNHHYSVYCELPIYSTIDEWMANDYEANALLKSCVEDVESYVISKMPESWIEGVSFEVNDDDKVQWFSENVMDICQRIYGKPFRPEPK